MSVPIISVAQMRSWEESSWANGQKPETVIQKVGAVLADRLREITRPNDTLVILAGKGHNGDDARAAATHLTDRSKVLISVTDPAAALQELNGIPAFKTGKAWIVDGLFGIGLDRPLDASWQALIDAVNASGLPVVSVDVPSGLDAQTGQPQGAAIRAAMTLTVGAPKIGLLSPSAKPYVGRLEVADNVGLIPCPVSSELQWTLPLDFQGYPPRRPIESNKGTFGHALLLAGSQGYHGAAVLATKGTLRAQPGLTTLFALPEIYQPLANQLFAAMVHPWRLNVPLPKNGTAILVGPGLANEAIPNDFKFEVRHLWKNSMTPMVIDASGLDWILPQASPAGAIRVITPHPGEAGRMLGISADKVQADRMGALRELSLRYGNAYVVLKGHQTLVGRSTGEVFVNPSGNPFLAQGGSGDVLAGYLTGLIAQPELQKDLLRTLRYGVWQHGASADQLTLTRPNWTPEELVEHLGLAQIP